MAYIGNIKDRIEITATLTGEYKYTTSYGWRETTNRIYTMKDDDGNVLVWKTTGFLVIEKVVTDRSGREYIESEFAHLGDRIRIKGTVKDHSEYKGTEQTVLTRVKLVEITAEAPTKEELEEAKRAEQIASLKEGDDVLYMPYRNYKNHYSDCETLAGSYDNNDRTIGVIVRNGRLKASGVRGKHYSGYSLKNEKGERVVYRAICEENAIRRAAKEYGGSWECVHVYEYEREW